MVRTHKIRLRPNAKQSELLLLMASYSNFCYDRALAILRQQKMKQTKNLRNVRDYMKSNPLPFQAHRPPAILDTAVEDLSVAFEKFKSKSTTNFKAPVFKGKKSKKISFRIYRKNDSSIRCVGKTWKFLKEEIKMCEELRFIGKSKIATAKFENGYWWLCVSVDYPSPTPPAQNNKTVGLDWGLKHFITTSDGNTYDIPVDFDIIVKKRKKLQQELSKCKADSKRRLRCRNRLTKSWFRTNNIKIDFLNKLATELAGTYSNISIETLSPRVMVKNRRLAGSVMRNCSERFYSLLESKTLNLQKVPRYFPSTQQCSCCQNVKIGKDKLKLSDRTYHCKLCGTCIDRDLNAAINIREIAFPN